MSCLQWTVFQCSSASQTGWVLGYWSKCRGYVTSGEPGMRSRPWIGKDLERNLNLILERLINREYPAVWLSFEPCTSEYMSKRVTAVLTSPGLLPTWQLLVGRIICVAWLLLELLGLTCRCWWWGYEWRDMLQCRVCSFAWLTGLHVHSLEVIADTSPML